MQFQQARPPFVRFDYQEDGQDTEASERAGRPIPRTRPFAFITPHGSKDVFEQPAEDWLKKKRHDAIEGKENPDWVSRWEMQYQEWMKGNELPREGTPVKTWYAINKEQINRLIAMNIATVEDLAAMPDSSLGMIGLDGRNLRDLAKNCIQQGLDVGVQAKKIADLEQSLRDKEDTIKGLMERMAALENKPLGLPKKG